MCSKRGRPPVSPGRSAGAPNTLTRARVRAHIDGARERSPPLFPGGGPSLLGTLQPAVTRGYLSAAPATLWAPFWRRLWVTSGLNTIRRPQRKAHLARRPVYSGTAQERYRRAIGPAGAHLPLIGRRRIGSSRFRPGSRLVEPLVLDEEVQSRPSTSSHAKAQRQ